MADHVKCIECDNMILPQTAADNAGLCGQCVKISPELGAEKREYQRRLTSGLVFRPSDAELATASVPAEFFAARWRLQPDYYSGKSTDTVTTIIATAMAEPQGNVFLVTDDGEQLNLGFTSRYGVCEYQNEEAGECRYAYSDCNLREQVPAELHVVQASPCCGVEMLRYPSRFHLPRDKAFSILEHAVSNRHMPGIAWLTADDFSYTDRGRG